YCISACCTSASNVALTSSVPIQTCSHNLEVKNALAVIIWQYYQQILSFTGKGEGERVPGPPGRGREACSSPTFRQRLRLASSRVVLKIFFKIIIATPAMKVYMNTYCIYVGDITLVVGSRNIQVWRRVLREAMTGPGCYAKHDDI
ncbi:hypothetical protein L9F63_011301, partial [Diploptera punctata]